MEITVDQVLDNYAVEHGYTNWNDMFYDNGIEIGTKGIETIASRYAQQFQAPTDALTTEVCVLRERVAELEDWKESAMNVFSNLQLQELGKVLDIKLGEDISSNVLPKVKCLIERVKELEECLRDIRNCNETWMDLFQSDRDKIESLINKSK